MRDKTIYSQQVLTRRLMPLGWGLLALVGLLVGLTWGALQIQIALAALLNGESVWSKAQKQLVIDLDTYASSGDAERLAGFKRNFTVLEYDRFARDETAKDHYDYDQVVEALSHDNAIREAIPTVIFMLRYLPGAPYLRDALQAWRSTDAAIAELDSIAQELQRSPVAGVRSNQDVARYRARISVLNDYIQPRSDLFSKAIANGASWLGKVLFASVLGAACIAALLWFRMARRILAGIRGSEERYRLLFDNAADGIVMVEENSGLVLDANSTASSWIRRDAADLVGMHFAHLFAESGLSNGAGAKTGTLRASDGGSRLVETQSSLVTFGDKRVRQAIIRDISERVAMEQERRIAAEALASIAEGVIIADANRTVITANDASFQLTGFSTQRLQRFPLGDTRTLPDGEPLPAAIWETIARVGHWHGEVRSRRHDGTIYPEQLSISAIRDDYGKVQHYVAVFTDISAHKANQARLERLATRDTLTGLVNRTEFEAHCSRAIKAATREHAAVVVLFIDLDAFKNVNDSFSHGIGDKLLIRVAERIQQQLAANEVAGRIGGDEFTVLIPRLDAREDAAGLSARLLLSLSEPYMIEEQEIVLTASIGIAGYPLDGGDAVALIANADAAMYAAKAAERNAFRFYLPVMHANVRRRLRLASDLRQALADEEFSVVYQPTVEMQSGRIIAVEALLRWHHPERGEIPPSEFIPMAESLGQIRQIDQWVMQTVFAQLQAWTQAGMPSIRVALNVSASWFGHPAFVEFLTRTLQTTQVSPDRLLLEITESSILRLGEDTDRTMKALQALGISVAIDDFGTGYSSMAYLKLPAVAYLKIDRSFVTGLPDNANDAAIVQAMLAISQSLGLRTIAEGIESEAQHEFLLRAGCAEAQGYLYSYPLNADEISRLLSPNPKLGKVKLQLVATKHL
jgi:diguanylate cyclase (GGDEF)-like protein/PAS domain S-box-containing protein